MICGHLSTVAKNILSSSSLLVLDLDFISSCSSAQMITHLNTFNKFTYFYVQCIHGLHKLLTVTDINAFLHPLFLHSQFKAFYQVLWKGAHQVFYSYISQFQQHIRNKISSRVSLNRLNRHSKLYRKTRQEPKFL